MFLFVSCNSEVAIYDKFSRSVSCQPGCFLLVYCMPNLVSRGDRKVLWSFSELNRSFLGKSTVSIVAQLSRPKKSSPLEVLACQLDPILPVRLTLTVLPVH